MIEPRCPECGYQFIWAELLDRKLTEHPYLFKHHPERNVWSFFRTAAGGLNPMRFWRTLRPQMTPRPRRLLSYWIVCTASPALLGAALLVAIAVADNFFPRPSPLVWNHRLPRCRDDTGQYPISPMSESVPAVDFPAPPPPVDRPPVLCPLCIYDLRGLIESRCPVFFPLKNAFSRRTE